MRNRGMPVIYSNMAFGQPAKIGGLSWVRAVMLMGAFIVGFQAQAVPPQALSNVALTLFGQEAWVDGTLPEIAVGEGTTLAIGIPETTRLASVRAQLNPEITAQRFELSRTPSSKASFLEMALGEPVQIRRGPDRAAVEGVLVAGSPLMVQTSAGLQNASLEDLIFPTLFLTDQSLIRVTLSGSGALVGQLQYAAEGLSWKAVYELKYFPEDRRVFIEPWALISNGTNQDFQNVELRLNAGTLNRGNLPPPMRPEFSRMSLAAAEDNGLSELQSTGLYHQWRLSQRADLPSQSDIKLPLQMPFEAEAEVFYRMRSQVQSYRAEAEPGAVTVPGFLRVTPTLAGEERGAPIAAGIARVFSVDGDGGAFFQGEDTIGTVPHGEPFEVGLGQAFDIRLRRKIASFRVLGNRAREIGIELELENTGESDAKVVLVEAIGGDFTLMNASPELKAGPNQSVGGDLMIAGGDKRKLAYKIRLNF